MWRTKDWRRSVVPTLHDVVRPNTLKEACLLSKELDHHENGQASAQTVTHDGNLSSSCVVQMIDILRHTVEDLVTG